MITTFGTIIIPLIISQNKILHFIMCHQFIAVWTFDVSLLAKIGSLGSTCHVYLLQVKQNQKREVKLN